MSKWKWSGFDKDRKMLQGEMDVKNERELRRILRSKGIRIKKLHPPTILDLDLGEILVEKGLIKRFSNVELKLFTRQLAILTNAGVSLIQALTILERTTKNIGFKKVIHQVAHEVQEGESFSNAIEKQKTFSALYCNLIRAGEAGGNLDVILNKLSVHLEKQEKIKSRIKSAMTYPAIVTLVGIVVIFGMMVFVVPQFTTMLESNNQEIPFVTQLVIDISDFLKEWALLAILGALIGFGILKVYVQSEDGKPVFDHFLMNIPVFGQLEIKGNLSAFSMTLAMTLGSGMPLLDSLSICIKIIGNTVIGKDLTRVKERVSEGSTLASQVVKIKYFPEMIAQMIAIGEQTGSLDSMLNKISSVLEEEVNVVIDNISKSIEPLIIAVLGGIIAFILIAVYMPIFLSAGGGV